MALLGVVAAQGIYESYTTSVEFWLKRLVAEMLMQVNHTHELEEGDLPCASVFNHSIEGLSSDDLNKICGID